MLQYIETYNQPGVEPEYTMIWCHGLGSNPESMMAVVEQLNLNKSVRFIFPYAPIRPVTLNHNEPIPAWYDIIEMNRYAPQDEAGLLQSMHALQALIDHEIQRGTPADHIFMAGFSQGCAMTLLLTLRSPAKLAGAIALSGYVPIHYTTPAKKFDTPIFMAHGDIDDVVPFDVGYECGLFLKEIGYDVEWHQYHIDHSICAEEIMHINQFINQNYPLPPRTVSNPF